VTPAKILDLRSIVCYLDLRSSGELVVVEEPLSAPEVRKLVRDICENGTVEFSPHAYEEMAKDSLSELDALNVLRGGWPEPGEFERSSYRYRIRTQNICVVVAFRSETWLVVVTAWRDR
jgi:hypothetical protein